jgi:hypothetical protein
MTAISVILILASTTKRVVLGQMYYPFAYLLSFILMFMVKSFLRIAVILNPTWINNNDVSVVMLIFFVLELMFYVLFFTTIRVPQMETTKAKLLKTSLKAILFILPTSLVVISGFLRDTSIVRDIPSKSVEFFIKFYSTDSVRESYVYLGIFFFFFVFCAFLMNHIISLKISPFLKTSFVLFQVQSIMVIVQMNLTPSQIALIEKPFVLAFETVRFLMIGFLSLSMWRGDDNV